MKKSTMLLIAGIIAVAVLTGGVDSINPPAPPVSECYNWPWWYLKCTGNDLAYGWNHPYNIGTISPESGGMEQSGY